MLAITFDIDWAPDEVVDYCVQKIIRAGVKATLFCTDYERDRTGRSSNLAERYKEHAAQLEFALHPNFVFDEMPVSVFDRLLRLYPNAKGFRSHNALTGGVVLFAAVQKGLRYDSNYFILDRSTTCLLWDFNFVDMVQIPVSFIDHGYSTLRCPIYDVHRLGFLAGTGLKVLDFHPSAIYLNLDRIERYVGAKDDYHDPEKLWKHRNQENPGADYLFTQLLEQIAQSQVPTSTLNEINDEFRSRIDPAERNPYLCGEDQA
jgi:hypothetical protein